MMMKRGMVDKQSLWFPAIGTWGYAIRAYMLGSIECDVSYQYHIWILVNPRLSMNEAWMYECAATLQPLADHYRKKPYNTKLSQ